LFKFIDYFWLIIIIKMVEEEERDCFLNIPQRILIGYLKAGALTLLTPYFSSFYNAWDKTQVLIYFFICYNLRI